jgi:hypothetical protein
MTHTYTLFSKADFVERQVLSASPIVSTLRQDLTLPSLPSGRRKKIVTLKQPYMSLSFRDDDDNLVVSPFSVHVPQVLMSMKTFVEGSSMRPFRCLSAVPCTVTVTLHTTIHNTNAPSFSRASDQAVPPYTPLCVSSKQLFCSAFCVDV